MNVNLGRCGHGYQRRRGEPGDRHGGTRSGDQRISGNHEDADLTTGPWRMPRARQLEVEGGSSARRALDV